MLQLDFNLPPSQLQLKSGKCCDHSCGHGCDSSVGCRCTFCKGGGLPLHFLTRGWHSVTKTGCPGSATSAQSRFGITCDGFDLFLFRANVDHFCGQFHRRYWLGLSRPVTFIVLETLVIFEAISKSGSTEEDGPHRSQRVAELSGRELST